MTFTTAVRTCLQEKYASFEGRARRSEYWWFQLFYLFYAFVVVALVYLLRTEWAALLLLAVLAPQVAVTVRRLHDTSRSGGWWFIGLVPYVGPVVLLVLCCLDSDPSNRYGPSPKIEPNTAAYLQPGT